jgi:hypothetical protein
MMTHGHPADTTQREFRSLCGASPTHQTGRLRSLRLWPYLLMTIILPASGCAGTYRMITPTLIHEQGFVAAQLLTVPDRGRLSGFSKDCFREMTVLGTPFEVQSVTRDSRWGFRLGLIASPPSGFAYLGLRSDVSLAVYQRPSNSVRLFLGSELAQSFGDQQISNSSHSTYTRNAKPQAGIAFGYDRRFLNLSVAYTVEHLGFFSGSRDTAWAENGDTPSKACPATGAPPPGLFEPGTWVRDSLSGLGWSHGPELQMAFPLLRSFTPFVTVRYLFPAWRLDHMRHENDYPAPVRRTARIHNGFFVLGTGLLFPLGRFD